MIRTLLISLFFIGSSVIYSGCLKPDEAPLSDIPPTYDITYYYDKDYYGLSRSIKDSLLTMIIYNDTESNQRFDFNILTGNPINYPIKCFFTGLPPGVTVGSDTITFRLSYAPGIKFVVRDCTPGFYLFELNTISQMEGLKTYPMRLYVLPAIPPQECAACLTGKWKSPNNCSTGVCEATISQVSGTAQSISIKNFACFGDSVEIYANVSCTDGINIPLQTNHGHTIYGGYKYTAGSPCSYIAISIPFTKVYNGDTQSCVLHLLR